MHTPRPQLELKIIYHRVTNFRNFKPKSQLPITDTAAHVVRHHDISDANWDEITRPGIKQQRIQDDWDKWFEGTKELPEEVGDQLDATISKTMYTKESNKPINRITWEMRDGRWQAIEQ